MKNPEIIVEIFCAPNCNRCTRAVDLVQSIILEIDVNTIQYRKLNVVEEIDYAVELGVIATPSIVINGKLAFTATPDKESLKHKLLSLL